MTAATLPSFALLLGGAVCLEIVADVLFKHWAIGNRLSVLLLGLVFYGAGTVLWAWSLKYETLSQAINAFTIVNLVAGTLAGVFLFQEHLSTVNICGILLGIVSLVLIEY